VEEKKRLDQSSALPLVVGRLLGRMTAFVEIQRD
jgi:hypothetical protein